jgi:hypothetical protein
MSADPDLASEGSELAVSPAVSLGGGKKPSKSPTKRPNPFAGGKGFQKGGKGSFSRGGRY